MFSAERSWDALSLGLGKLRWLTPGRGARRRVGAPAPALSSERPIQQSNLIPVFRQ